MVTIIIVNWNTEDWIAKCIGKIEEFPPKVEHEIILIDNGSEKGRGFKEWSDKHLKYRYIWNTINMGFGYACNQGVMAAEGKYICLLNPDTEPSEGWLDYMVEYLEGHPEVGLVGPSTNNSCCKDQFPDFNKGETIDNIHNIIPFLCVVVPKRVLVLYGLFSMAYVEDIEFNQRIKGKGLKTKVVGKAFVKHAYNSSYLANNIGRDQPTQRKFHEEVLYPRLMGR